ncbi:MAG: methyltransferase domain-containing protein [Myxococcales bacterium]|nr:methyltransferase domain-containing protein [Myxococcota bacterium]MDW8283221.1 methyltransferase domain-containing protein [Myxococcales bacterium]
MKLGHFAALGPLCGVCQQEGNEAPLVLGRVLATAGEDDVLEGILLCSRCGREYPIIDGIPLLIPALRAYLAQNVLQVVQREDLSDVIESLLGDCCGPGSAYDQTRQHLSSYVHGHYGDLDPEETNRPADTEGSGRLPLLHILETGLAHVAALPAGPLLDAGCAVGRSSFGLAAAFSSGAEAAGRLVLGIDLNFSMLRVASRVLRTGQVRYARRRVGLVYDRRTFPVCLAGAERVDFWACDAQALPFPTGTFALAASLNLLDCVASPYAHLLSLGRVLQVGGYAILATPYDWSPGATPIEGWVGGHSQRGPEAGSSEQALRALLGVGGHPAALPGLCLAAEVLSLPWPVRLHDRGTLHYRVHLAVVERTAA